jgi:hypothetical protein
MKTSTKRKPSPATNPFKPGRKRSRKSASSRGAVAIPDEILHMLAQRISKSQRALIVFSMVCRGARDAVLGNHEMWFEILRRTETQHFNGFRFSRIGPAVVRNIPMAPYPNFKFVEGNPRGSPLYAPMSWLRNQSEWPHVSSPEQTEPFTALEMETFAEFAQRRARICHSKRCGFCGCRFGHMPVWGLGRRACNTCLKHNLISSAALIHEYGFDFTRHMSTLAGRVYFFSTRDKRLIQQSLSHNPLDFRTENRFNLTFFWRPHLERVVDLQESRLQLRAKTEAARVAQAAVRALVVRITLMQRGKNCTSSSSHKFFLYAPGASAPRRGSPFYSDSPVSPEDAQFVREHSPHLRSCYLIGENQLRARAILQRAFLAFRGRVTLPNVQNQAGVLDRLRMNEALREELVGKVAVPVSSSPLFTAWRDMHPTLGA